MKVSDIFSMILGAVKFDRWTLVSMLDAILFDKLVSRVKLALISKL